MLWSRTKPPLPREPHLLGLEIDSTSARAAVCVNGKAQPLPLGGDAAELPLVVHLETGRVGAGAVRREPHHFCTNFLTQLGKPREWCGPRRRYTPATALAAAAAVIGKPLAAWGGRTGLVLPESLSSMQIKEVTETLEQSRIQVAVSAGAALAIVAHRAGQFFQPAARQEAERGDAPEWVVPLRPNRSGPGLVLLLEVDDASLRAAALNVADAEVALLAQADVPRAAWRLWKERLIDGLSDRCVRLCRRDPRDCADAEQGLWDQLEAALEHARRGHPVVLTARANRWYQDLPLTAAELEAMTAGLADAVLVEVRRLLDSLPLPPKAVWLSARCASLPGLAAAVREQTPEGAEVSVLPADAGADAAAALAALAAAGTLAAGHHAHSLPGGPALTAPPARVRSS